MGSCRPRLPSSVLQPAESQESNIDFVDLSRTRKVDGFSFRQHPNTLKCRQERPDQPREKSPDNGNSRQENVRKHTLKIDWKDANKLIERKRHRGSKITSKVRSLRWHSYSENISTEIWPRLFLWHSAFFIELLRKPFKFYPTIYTFLYKHLWMFNNILLQSVMKDSFAKQGIEIKRPITQVFLLKRQEHNRKTYSNWKPNANITSD